MSLPPSQAEQADSPLTVKYELEFGYADLAKQSVRITHEKMSFLQLLPPAGILLASRDFTAQAQTFRTKVSAIRRYNLFPKPTEPVSPLRGGQASLAESSAPLSIPKQKKVSWSRILRTLGVIAPNLKLIELSERLPSEEIEFYESALPLQIESWELSGGMARALGILLALETHPEEGTLLIEEPEQSLHPWAIRALMEHIREVTDARNLQVILNTKPARYGARNTLPWH
jgi:hypothetical protein